MNLVWIHHPDTGGRAEVPADAVPMYRQSGWDLLPKKVVAEMEKAAADELAAAELAMRASAAATIPTDPSQSPPAAETTTTATATTTKENG